jgi:hypothetical protein
MGVVGGLVPRLRYTLKRSADFIVYSQGVTFSTISKKLNE